MHVLYAYEHTHTLRVEAARFAECDCAHGCKGHACSASPAGRFCHPEKAMATVGACHTHTHTIGLGRSSDFDRPLMHHPPANVGLMQ